MVDGAASRDGLGNEVFNAVTALCAVTATRACARPGCVPARAQPREPRCCSSCTFGTRSGLLVQGARSQERYRPSDVSPRATSAKGCRRRAWSRPVRPARSSALCACAPAHPRASLPGLPSALAPRASWAATRLILFICARGWAGTARLLRSDMRRILPAHGLVVGSPRTSDPRRRARSKSTLAIAPLRR